jgi:ribonuclease HI
MNIYTDGSCLGNPGPGGWAVMYVISDGCSAMVAASEELTTNNRVELKAVDMALRELARKPELASYVKDPHTIYTDSQNVIGWLSLGWKRKNPEIRKLCANIEKTIEENNLNISFAKVKAHSDDKHNDWVDSKARALAESLL